MGKWCETCTKPLKRFETGNLKEGVHFPTKPAGGKVRSPAWVCGIPAGSKPANGSPGSRGQDRNLNPETLGPQSLKLFSHSCFIGSTQGVFP